MCQGAAAALWDSSRAERSDAAGAPPLGAFGMQAPALLGLAPIAGTARARRQVRNAEEGAAARARYSAEAAGTKAGWGARKGKIEAQLAAKREAADKAEGALLRRCALVPSLRLPARRLPACLPAWPRHAAAEPVAAVPTCRLPPSRGPDASCAVLHRPALCCTAQSQPAVCPL